MAGLQTERLLLRKAVETDLAAFHAILSDAKAMAFWSSTPHESREQSRDWLEGMMQIAPDEGEDFVVEHQGRVIGKAGLYRFPEIGFIFHPDVWGQGFASEALRTVVERGFTTHKLPSIEADVDPRNDASLRLLGRLGFQEVGRKARTWLIGDRWCDSVYLRLDAERWPIAV